MAADRADLDRGRRFRMGAVPHRLKHPRVPDARRLQSHPVCRPDLLQYEMIETIQWTDAGVVMIDQTRLPREEVYITCRDYRELAEAIRGMVVRGAPAIGVAAAMGVAIGVQYADAARLD